MESLEKIFYDHFEKNQCVGITRGVRNTKIRAVVDALANPIYVQLSFGDINDSAIAEDVMDHVELEPDETTVLTDKAWHVADCFFNKLKENRRIASWFDKQIYHFLAFVHLDLFVSCLHDCAVGSNLETRSRPN